MEQAFAYENAFSRNLGWLTPAEQQLLRRRCVAIAGMGAVGGLHLMALARLGVGAFRIADFDHFEVHNFNRQIGAVMSSVGRPKVEVMAEMARDVNPELKLTSFPQGITRENVGAFLDGVDVYVDGLDFFAFEARHLVFTECAARRIPAITAAPLGMGAALLNFLPGGMGFDDYFGWTPGMDESEMALRFALGVAPAGLHRGYLVNPQGLDFAKRRVPSTAMGCQMAAGLAATEVLKIVLQRGRVMAAPHGVHFDAYRRRAVRTWRPGGHRNPLQQVALAFGRRYVAKLSAPR
jgi:molybdopterin/thiamine biosynthesis adenylyltransferase